MQVTAFCNPARPEWRWRIVNYSGEMLEESYTSFPTIAAAVAQGTERLAQMNADAVDRFATSRGPWAPARQRDR